MSILKVDTLQNSVGENLVFGNKNLLINGSLSVWQRATTATVTGGYHTADRWDTNFTGLGTFTQSQSTDVPSGQGFGYSLKMDCTAADASPAATDKLFIEQKIEGQNLQHLLKSTANAKKITLSFHVKSNKTGTYVVKFLTTGGRFISKTYTINSASTWEKKEITVDGDTGGSAIANDNTEGMSVQWWLGAGSNFTTALQGTWATVTEDLSAQGQVNLADSTSNEWYMTGCQLEVGSKATDFEFEPYERTFNKCLRYYYWVGSVNKEGPGGLQQDGGWGTLCMRYNLSFPVSMRITPIANHGTFTLYRRSGGNGSVMSWITATLTNTKNNIWSFSNTRAYAQWGNYNNRGNGESMKGHFPNVNFDAEL
jgi:hypothetical protein